jgi:hypothetical protein
MCILSKIFTFCPDDIKAIADDISKGGKIAMKKLEDNLTELV